MKDKAVKTIGRALIAIVVAMVILLPTNAMGGVLRGDFVNDQDDILESATERINE